MFVPQRARLRERAWGQGWPPREVAGATARVNLDREEASTRRKVVAGAQCARSGGGRTRQLRREQRRSDAEPQLQRGGARGGTRHGDHLLPPHPDETAPDGGPNHHLGAADEVRWGLRGCPAEAVDNCACGW